MKCPSFEDTLGGVLSLLPRGRAWSNNEGGPEKPVEAAFDAGAFDEGAFATESRTGTVLYRYWAAFAAVLAFFNRRLCDLRLEFFCATVVETRADWMAEYGLPDPCDAYPDLCAKVAAIGGTRCEYFQAIAARMGWLVECLNDSVPCGGMMGCSTMGDFAMGVARGTHIRMIVHLAESPAYTGGPQTPPVMGLWQMGQPISCSPDLTPLQCLIERIAPAHVEVDYIPA